MRLNHANLCSSDVGALSGVFARHFGFEPLQTGTYKGEYAILRGTDGFFLVITEIGADSPREHPTDFHVGFMVDEPGEVLAKHRELAEGGLQPGPIKNFEAMGATWTAFYCPVGDGIDIEVNAHVPTASAPGGPAPG